MYYLLYFYTVYINELRLCMTRVNIDTACSIKQVYFDN